MFGNRRGLSTPPFTHSLTKINYNIAQSLLHTWTEEVLPLSSMWEQARLQDWTHTKLLLTQQNYLYLPMTYEEDVGIHP